MLHPTGGGRDWARTAHPARPPCLPGRRSAAGTMPASSVDDRARSFERYLRAGNKSPRTVETYLEALAGFSAHLAATSKRPLDQASREDVETWIALLLGQWKPSTAHNRYHGLHAFYRWLRGGRGHPESDGQDEAVRRSRPARPSPQRAAASRLVRRMRRHGLRGPPRHRGADGPAGCLAAPLGTARHAPGRSRLRVRRGEGGRQGWAGTGLAVRPQDRHGAGSILACSIPSPPRAAGCAVARAPGPLTISGLRDLLDRCARQAGIPALHPHMFRHTFAHEWLSAGGNETDLMRIAGWRSRDMLARYGAVTPTLACRRTTGCSSCTPDLYQQLNDERQVRPLPPHHGRRHPRPGPAPRRRGQSARRAGQRGGHRGQCHEAPAGKKSSVRTPKTPFRSCRVVRPG
jgi:integrase